MGARVGLAADPGGADLLSSISSRSRTMCLRRTLLASVALLAFGAPLRAGEPADLKVLYAGNPGSDREKDFRSFLEKHFAKVGTADYREFSPDRAKGYDVVILDWTSIYPRDEHGKIEPRINRLNSPTPPKLPADYDRPTILIGAAGAYVAQPLRLKIDWL
jgi:hypothetical protein